MPSSAGPRLSVAQYPRPMTQTLGQLTRATCPLARTHANPRSPPIYDRSPTPLLISSDSRLLLFYSLSIVTPPSFSLPARWLRQRSCLPRINSRRIPLSPDPLPSTAPLPSPEHRASPSSSSARITQGTSSPRPVHARLASAAARRQHSPTFNPPHA